MSLNCEVCETHIDPGRHGPSKKYCSERCRSRARRAKAKKQAGKLQLVAKDERPQARKVKQADFEAAEVETLHPRARKWVERVFQGWEIPASEHPLVVMAGTALSRALEARELIEKDGLVLAGLHASKAHPAVPIERDATTMFARLLKQLELG